LQNGFSQGVKPEGEHSEEGQENLRMELEISQWQVFGNRSVEDGNSERQQ
jgi:hypothetical protein